MKRHVTPTVLLAGLVAAPAGPALGADEGSEVEALRRQVEALRHELDEVKRANDDNWLTEQRAEEIKGLVADVLADADTRASLYQNGMTAGHDGKFFLASADGNWRLNIEGQLQIRWALNSTRDDADKTQWGFENRRTKLKFSGHVLDPTWQFSLQGEFDRTGGPGGGGNFGLEDAWIRKDFENGWALRAGQYKGPLLREELVSSSRQLAVERSLINETYNQGRSQGLELQWQSDNIRANVYYGDGFRTRNTNYANTAGNNGTEFAIAGRAEWLVTGGWKQFRDFTSWSGDDQGIMLGVAGWWQNGAAGTADSGQEFASFTADVSWEAHPFNAYAAFIWTQTNDARFTPSGGTARERGLGIVGQLGYHLVPDEWEVFGRYEWGDTGGSDAANAIADLSLVTVGVNWYIAKEKVKWATDFGYAFSQVDGLYATSGANYRTSGVTGEFVIRSQFQLLF